MNERMNGSGQPLGLHRAQGKTPKTAVGLSPGGFLGRMWGKEAVSLLHRKPELTAWPNRHVPGVGSLAQGQLSEV